jgi:hypothetical protein
MQFRVAWLFFYLVSHRRARVGSALFYTEQRAQTKVNLGGAGQRGTVFNGYVLHCTLPEYFGADFHRPALDNAEQNITFRVGLVNRNLKRLAQNSLYQSSQRIDRFVLAFS